jgi:flagellar protein FliL
MPLTTAPSSGGGAGWAVNSRTVVIISIIIALLSGGVAAYVALTGHGLAYYFASAEPAKKPVQLEAPPEVAFIRLDPLQLTIPGADRRNYQLLLSLNLELASPSKEAVARQLLPRLRDSFIREMYSQPLNSSGRWSAADIEILRQRLVKQSQLVMGAGVVSNVLIQQAIPIN